MHLAGAIQHFIATLVARICKINSGLIKPLAEVLVKKRKYVSLMGSNST
jgi:hypothetical protein